jgi:hypothetical protein
VVVLLGVLDQESMTIAALPATFPRMLQAKHCFARANQGTSGNKKGESATAAATGRMMISGQKEDD